MNCDKERLALYLEGDLDPTEAGALEQHLSECEDCQSYLDELRESQEALFQLRGEVFPSSDLDDVRTRVLDDVARWAPGVIWWPAAAILLVALGAAYWLSFPGATEPDPEPVARETVPEIEEETIDPEAAAAPAAIAVAEPEEEPEAVAVVADLTVPEPREPLTLHLLTDDPDIVIMWLVD